MNKLVLLLILGAAGYWLYEKAKTQPVASALPADATAVQTMSVAGVPVTVYLAASGYYAQYTNPTSGAQKILGPYSQAQVSALLNAKSALSTLMSVA